MKNLLKNVFNIPLSNSFTDVVAAKYLEDYKDNPLGLADVLFILPSRRACASFKEAFVRARGLEPLILPRMIVMGDIDEEEISFSDSADVLDILPAISKMERILLFIKIIMAKPNDFGIEKLFSNQACFLAQELAGLIDLVNLEQLSFESLAKLVPEEYASHWQETLKFLEIITKHWPLILEERGVVDVSFRNLELLKLRIESWRKNPPKNKVVIAGVTATYPLMKELVKTVLSFENSEVLLAGLDKFLDDYSWEKVDEQHPQFELKDLLDYLEMSRFEVKDLVSSQNVFREKLISETMRPAKTTDKWRDIKPSDFGMEALHGLTLIETQDVREEALTIALLMRESLEKPESTTALVTTDRNLARRVAVELERWGIKVDDTAGCPLSLTPAGQFMRLIIKVLENDFEPVSFLSLLKHPYCVNGEEFSSFRKKVRDFEKNIRKGLEPKLESVEEKFSSLKGMFLQPMVSLNTVLQKHVELAVSLAQRVDKNGDDVLWRNDDGEALAKFIADLFEHSKAFGEIEPVQYLGLVEALMTGIMVRPRFGTHPRLKILGPIEARLSGFDTVIIGEVNEGAWPKLPSADPWMSRPMKKDFGMPQSEKAIGINAQDFASLFSGARVYLTRAARVQGTPMVKSRFWMRLETVLAAMGVMPSEIEDIEYKAWARHLDRVEIFKKLSPPEPKPPVDARPRELSASAIENLMRDPYIIFAKYILKLKPLDELNEELDAADFGNIMHAVLEKFNDKYPSSFPLNAKEKMLSLGEEYFAEHKVTDAMLAFWRPNLEKMVGWIVARETIYRDSVAKIYSEVKGSYVFDAPAGEFMVTAKADRVDVLKNGKINVIDYKTGQAKKLKEVKAGYAPQLPIEGIIASKGGFENLSKAEVEALMYWRLGVEETLITENIEETLAHNEQCIKDLISIFDFETTPYISRPRAALAPKYSDYEHLSRIKEWSVIEEGLDD